MVFRYTLKDNWPPLAWLAHCPIGGGEINVLHGRRVETYPGWFCEAVWAGEFSAGDLDQTDIVAGTGARSRNGTVVFVSSGSTVDRLQYFLDGDGLSISNSLCALLLSIGAQLDFTYPHFPADFATIRKGLHAFKREMHTSRGPVRLVYFHNLQWDGRRISEQAKPDARRDFSTFDRYHAFLKSAMQAVAKNARDPGRAHRYELLCAVSNGYDSPTVGVLAKSAGCARAFTFDVSRDGVDDSGARIGEALGMKTTVIRRDAWRGMLLAEIPFLAGAAGAGEVLFKGAEFLLGGTLLFTGLYGGSLWPRIPHDEGENLVGADASGLCLTEYRLHVGFIHCPVGFWGARQARDIGAISRSEEMKPWDAGGWYSRPICRRIVEQAGVPRDWFGQQKKGVSELLFRPGRFLESRTVEDYFSWLAENAHEWRKRGRFPPHPTLGRLLDVVLMACLGVLGFLRGIRPLRHPRVLGGFLRASIQHLNHPLYIRRYTFPWAVERTQERYR